MPIQMLKGIAFLFEKCVSHVKRICYFLCELKLCATTFEGFYQSRVIISYQNTLLMIDVLVETLAKDMDVSRFATEVA